MFSIKKNIDKSNLSIAEITRSNPKSVHQAFKKAFSHSLGAGLTIEASIALPVFLFFFACMIHFLILISLQADIQTHIDEAARKIGKQLYALRDSQAASAAAASSFALRAAILDDSLSEKIKNSQISGGISGVHTVLSGYDDETGDLDIIVTYTYKFPYLPKGVGKLNLSQSCSCRAWIGTELKDTRADDSNEDSSDKIVYITPTGSAYHITPSCSYLDLSIRTVSASSIGSLRNHSGSRYEKCSCASSGASSYYVTDYGELYHSDLTCKGLKRTVTAVPLSDVGSRHECSKCGSNDNK